MRLLRNVDAGRGRARRGFSLMLVLGALILMGGTLAVMSSLFAHEMKRTRAATAGAQVRALLLAGMPAAAEELALRGTGSREVSVPVPVKEGKLELRISGGADGHAVVVMRAGYEKAEERERVVFVRGVGGAWEVREAELKGRE